jgi:3-oxoacyl-[acyl-carrier-protein] synthase-3
LSVFRYANVCVEGFGHVLPTERVSSAEVERRLAPLYERLRLPAGRLELMTGIRERRFWAPGTLPSDKSIESAELAIASCGIERSDIGAVIHGSVCRDHLEPATACRVHSALGLSSGCLIYDVSNACLGILNGIVQVANMIELGQVCSGLVVGSEGSRQLVETTIDGGPRIVNREVVTLIREEWRVVDRWWTDEPIDRRYFEVVLESGRNVCVFRDRERACWFTQRA